MHTALFSTLVAAIRLSAIGTSSLLRTFAVCLSCAPRMAVESSTGTTLNSLFILATLVSAVSFPSLDGKLVDLENCNHGDKPGVISSQKSSVGVRTRRSKEIDEEASLDDGARHFPFSVHSDVSASRSQSNLWKPIPPVP